MRWIKTTLKSWPGKRFYCNQCQKELNEGEEVMMKKGKRERSDEKDVWLFKCMRKPSDEVVEDVVTPSKIEKSSDFSSSLEFQTRHEFKKRKRVIDLTTPLTDSQSVIDLSR